MDTDVLARIAYYMPGMAAAVRRREAALEERRARLRGPAVKVMSGTDEGAANAQVVIVADVGTKGLVATKDPYDGAHRRMDPLERLVSSAVGPARAKRLGAHARPRMYPPSHMGTSGVALDSSFDAAHDRAEWLRRELGLDLVGVSMATAVDRATDRIVAGGREVWEVVNRRGLRVKEPIEYQLKKV